MGPFFFFGRGNMGIDLKHKHKKNKNRWEPRSQDVYVRMLVKLYRFLARRTNSDFNSVVLKRLCMSKTNRPPISLSKLSVQMQGKNENQIAVVVGNVLNDPRLLDCPNSEFALLNSQILLVHVSSSLED